jgi:hypothetical protein
MDLNDIIWEYMGWSNLAHDTDYWLAFMNAVMNYKTEEFRKQLMDY